MFFRGRRRKINLILHQVKQSKLHTTVKKEYNLDLMLVAKLPLILKDDLVLLLNVCMLETESKYV